MVEEIEIKRKFFEVVESLGPRSKKVERKGSFYFLKEFGNDSEGFDDYVDGFNKLKVTGIRTPKLYMYDKARRIVVTDYVEGKTVFDILLEHDLDDEYFDLIFQMNFFCRKEKVLIDFYPSNFKVVNGKLFYLAMNAFKYDPNKSFEKKSMWYWAYSRDFIKSLIERKLPVDQKRANVQDGVINKELTLKVVKFFR